MNDVTPDPNVRYLCPNCNKEVKIHPKEVGQDYFAECKDCDADFFSIELIQEPIK
jgi:peptide subunit release factor 1 (eRF1)